MPKKRFDVEARVSVKDKASKNVKKIDSGFKRLTKTIKTSALAQAAAVGAAVVALRAAVRAIGSFIRAANKQEDAINALDGALADLGDRAPKISKALQEQASALQKLTKFGDEEIIEAQALIASFVKEGDAIKAATVATLDLAEAKGFSLVSAADLVSKTLGSSTNALTRYGIEVTGAVGSTERLTTLTENIAFFLRADPLSLRIVTRNLLGVKAEPAVAVHTQYPANGDRPDLVFELQSGRLLIVENKVDASLGDRQLERYLEIRSESGLESYLALMSRRHIPVAKGVLDSPRYLRPPKRNHWFWQDLYGWIPKPRGRLGIHHVRRCFLDYLELLRLRPTALSGSWEKLYDYDESAREVREAFGHKLAGVENWFGERRFQIIGDSQSGFQAKPKTDCGFKGQFLWFSLAPAVARRHLMEAKFSHRVDSEVFRVSLVYGTTDPPPEAVSVYERLPRPFDDGNEYEWWPVAPYQMTNRRVRLEVVASLKPFLEDDLSTEEKLSLGCSAVANELLRLVSS